MITAISRKGRIALALGLGLALGACGGGSGMENRSLYSVKQPVVERANYTLDLRTGAGGLTVPEQNRLADWFDSMELGAGDRVSIDDPLSSGATIAAVQEVADRYGVIVDAGAPVTAGYVDPGMARVVVTRSRAYVPGCPDWEVKGNANYANATHPGYGCAINSNIAAMVANPEHLIEGEKGTGETIIMTGTKAIDTYREAPNTGAGGLGQVATGGN
jgi:pilus assembly protein CpaD